jgi:uncharacterized protein DUF4124
MRTLAFTLMLLGCTLALAQAVYKWTDENGVVHYSDQPHANAEKIRVPTAQTYKAQPAAAAATASGEPAAASAQTYRGCAIVQPGAGEQFANIDSLTIVVQTDPPLRPGDRVYVTLDGQGINNGAPTGAQFNLSPVDRGQHSLQAVVRGSDGAVMCQTPGISFTVQQNTTLNPNNPNNRVVAPH